jgi:hypothetical protein
MSTSTVSIPTKKTHMKIYTEYDAEMANKNGNTTQRAVDAPVDWGIFHIPPTPNSFELYL